jgi:hypothetical protein
MPLDVGVANCKECGAQVGTVFSETNPAPNISKLNHRQDIAGQVVAYQKVESAQNRANSSLILALASFFCPGIGFLLGGTAVLLGALSLRTLKQYNIEESRGPATAGVVVGAMALIAQVCYLIYLMKVGDAVFG